MAGATAAVLVLAALIVLPGRAPGRISLATALLATEAGAVVVAGSVLVGAALRTERLLPRAAEAGQAVSLIRLSRLDGDHGGFFPLMILAIVVLGGLLAAVLALAARGSTTPDPLDQALATAVLIVEAALCCGAVVLVALGNRGLPLVLLAVALPVVVLAAFSAWPRRAPD
jgi:hypothetical protein